MTHPVALIGIKHETFVRKKTNARWFLVIGKSG
jgi:hypothetical protein